MVLQFEAGDGLVESLSGLARTERKAVFAGAMTTLMEPALSRLTAAGLRTVTMPLVGAATVSGTAAAWRKVVKVVDEMPGVTVGENITVSMPTPVKD